MLVFQEVLNLRPQSSLSSAAKHGACCRPICWSCEGTQTPKEGSHYSAAKLALITHSGSPTPQKQAQRGTPEVPAGSSPRFLPAVHRRIFPARFCHFFAPTTFPWQLKPRLQKASPGDPFWYPWEAHRTRAAREASVSPIRQHQFLRLSDHRSLQLQELE